MDHCFSSSNAGFTRADGKQIVDTLYIGSYYREMGGVTVPRFRVFHSESDSLIGRFRDGEEYSIAFKASNLEKYPFTCSVNENGFLSKIDSSSYTLRVSLEGSVDYIEFWFDLQLGEDSILIHRRDWTDTTKTDYTDSYFGYVPEIGLRMQIVAEEKPLVRDL